MLICVRNDVTARSPALYNQTTRMVHRRVMSVSVYLHLQGFDVSPGNGIKKKKQKHNVIANISLNLFLKKSEHNSSVASLLPCHSSQDLQYTTLLHPTGLRRFCFSELQSTNPPNNIKRAVCCFFSSFVVFLSLFLPWQSDHHVLEQIKGGPSGHETIKMTCCERMQSDM